MSRSRAPRRGGFAAFADPRLNALEAHHFWLPPSGGPALTAVAQAVQDPPQSEATVFVPALRGLEHILVNARRRQHLLFRNNGAVLQLTVEGVEVAYEPVVLMFLVHGPAALGRASKQLATLRRILAPTSPSAPKTRWADHTLKRRDAVIALDGREAGATYRDVAILLRGRKKANSDWDTGLKERMRRDLRRGEALARGRYRDLLT